MLGRLITAMATPFHADGGLDLDGARRLASHLVGTGTETVLVNGTTGESPTLTHDEQLDLLRAVRDEVGGRASVMVGTGTFDTAKTCALTEEVTAIGADAVLVVTPYYNRPSQRGLLRHFRDVAGSTDLPIILYDIPSRTAREIEVETLVELAQVGNIVGLKDAAGDLAKTAEVVARTPEDFVVYCGDDALTLPFLAVGAVGVVSVASHLAGNEIADMLAVFDQDPTKARELHQRLLPLARALFLEPSPAPLKGALNAVGLPAGPVRAPLADALPETVRAVLDALEVVRPGR